MRDQLYQDSRLAIRSVQEEIPSPGSTARGNLFLLENPAPANFGGCSVVLERRPDGVDHNALDTRQDELSAYLRASTWAAADERIDSDIRLD